MKNSLLYSLTLTVTLFSFKTVLAQDPKDCGSHLSKPSEVRDLVGTSITIKTFEGPIEGEVIDYRFGYAILIDKDGKEKAVSQRQLENANLIKPTPVSNAPWWQKSGGGSGYYGP